MAESSASLPPPSAVQQLIEKWRKDAAFYWREAETESGDPDGSISAANQCQHYADKLQHCANELEAALAILERERDDLKNSQGEQHAKVYCAWLNRAEAAEAHIVVLETLVQQWRSTATAWETELARGKYSGKWPSGKGNIQNWINWLRAVAADVEAALQAPDPQEPR